MSAGAARVQKHRMKLREKGLRPVQIWVPDTRTAAFADQCYLQSLRVNEVDSGDQDLSDLMDQVLEDAADWPE